MKTPLGNMHIAVQNGFVRRISFGKRTINHDVHPLLQQCMQELEEYFEGSRTSFSVPCRADGTAFEQHVWRALSNIPYGETVSYGEIAKSIGKPNATRAVGRACGNNPILLLVPCHRVIAASGKLGGFNGGLRRKRRLLAHERRYHQ